MTSGGKSRRVGTTAHRGGFTVGLRGRPTPRASAMALPQTPRQWRVDALWCVRRTRCPAATGHRTHQRPPLSHAEACREEGVGLGVVRPGRVPLVRPAAARAPTRRTWPGCIRHATWRCKPRRTAADGCARNCASEHRHLKCVGAFPGGTPARLCPRRPRWGLFIETPPSPTLPRLREGRGCVLGCGHS